eukprot:4801542-Pyramimonas_sp.AAC.1
MVSEGQGYIPARGPITEEPSGIYPHEDQSNRGSSGDIPARGPITGEPAGIYPHGDQSQGSQR